MDDWLELEDVPVAELPDWAKTGVTLGDVGITIVRRGRGSLVPWGSVLGVVIPPGAKGYILAARREPHPPWFVIDNAMLQADLASEGIVGVKRRFEERMSQVVEYRRGPTVQRPNLSLEELSSRAARREPIPGALNVPVASNAPSGAARLVVGSVASGSLAYMGLYGGVILAWLAQLEELSSVFGMAGVLVGGVGGVALGVLHKRPKPADQRPRVLLLAPDGCLCAFEGGARALSWDEVTEFALGESPRGLNLLALHVRGPEGMLHGTIDLHWFDVPSEVVQVIAESYRASYTD